MELFKETVHQSIAGGEQKKITQRFLDMEWNLLV